MLYIQRITMALALVVGTIGLSLIVSLFVSYVSWFSLGCP
jgi:hypothetical protein